MSRSALARLTAPVALIREYAVQGLQLMGFLPISDQDYQQVERRIMDALPPVAAPPDFRQELASNLALIAQQKEAGLIIKRSHAYHPGILIGVGAGVLATGTALMVLLLRSRIEHSSQV